MNNTFRYKLLLTYVFILVACANPACTNKSIFLATSAKKNAFKITTNPHHKLYVWLLSLGINIRNLSDTTVMDIFAFNEWRHEQKEIDSNLLWYPSTDSSYYLITNCCFETRNSTDTSILHFHFYSTDSMRIFSSLGVLNFEAQYENVSYFWYDEKTLYFAFRKGNLKPNSIDKIEFERDYVSKYVILAEKEE